MIVLRDCRLRGRANYRPAARLPCATIAANQVGLRSVTTPELSHSLEWVAKLAAASRSAGLQACCTAAGQPRRAALRVISRQRTLIVAGRVPGRLRETRASDTRRAPGTACRENSGGSHPSPR